jgi:DNA-binding beta-propeller fold protein YncE
MKGRRTDRGGDVVYYLAEDFVWKEGSVTMQTMNSRQGLIWGAGVIGVLLLSANFTAAQAPSRALLVLEKSDNSLAIVDPANLQIVARLPAGPDPHEIVASPDGKLAYISNYGGSDSTLNTISVIDLAARKALPPINLGALRSAHGLAFAGGKLYFTAETNKIVGRYDLATQSVDLVFGIGQDRTHMVAVNESLDRIVTSNVSSGTISIIEQVSLPVAPAVLQPGTAGPTFVAGSPPPGTGPPTGLPRKTWRVTNVATGRGAEGFDVSPDGKEIWAANAQDATVTIIDIASKHVRQTVPIPVRGANRLKFTPDGKRVLASGLGAGAGANLVILDAATGKELKTFDLGGGAAGILIVPGGSRAYVAVSAKDKVAVVDLKNLEVTGYVSTGRQPDGLAWVQ